VENKVKELCAVRTDLKILGQEVVEDFYFDTVADEIRDELATKGALNVADIATRIDIPVDILRSAVESRLASIEAEMRHSTLYTQDYLRRQKAIIRGFLLAATRPTFISSFAQRFSILDDIILEAAKELCRDKEVNGVVKGGEYVPGIFAQMQRSSVDAFFTSNGFISNDRLHKLRMNTCRVCNTSEAYEFVLKSFPNSVLLNTIIAGPAIVDRIGGLVIETMRIRSWADVGQELPGEFSADDVVALLQRCDGYGNEYDYDPVKKTTRNFFVTVADTYIFSFGFLNDVMDDVLQLAEATAIGDSKKIKSGGGSIPRPVDDEDDVSIVSSKTGDSGTKGGGKGSKGGGGKAKKGGRGKRGKGDSDDEEEEEAEPVVETNSKKKGKGGGKESSKSGSKATTGGKKGADSSSTNTASLSKEVVKSLFIKRAPELKEDLDGDVLSALIEEVFVVCETLYSSQYSSSIAKLFQGQAEEKRKRFVAFEHAFDKSWVQLQLANNAHSAFKADSLQKGPGDKSAALSDEKSDDDNGSDLINDYLASVLCLNIAVAVLHHYAFQYGNAQSIPAEETLSASTEARKAVLSTINDKAVQSVFTQLFQAVKVKNVEQFISLVAANTGVLNIRALPLDRKSEKQLVFGRRHELSDHIAHYIYVPSAIESVSDLLSSTLQLLYLHVHNVALSIPANNSLLGSLIKKLKSCHSIHADHIDVLQALCDHCSGSATCGDVEQVCLKVKTIGGLSKEALKAPATER
jgi:hypothetical protein